MKDKIFLMRLSQKEKELLKKKAKKKGTTMTKYIKIKIWGNK